MLVFIELRNLFRKLLAFCFLLILGLIMNIQSVFAHPLDISNSSITVHNTTISVVTSFHPSQVESTIAASGIPYRSITYDDYIGHADALYSYIKNHVSFKDSAGNACELGEFSSVFEGIEDLYIRGFPVSYTAKCRGPLDEFEYTISIYTQLPLQTNRVSIYDGASGIRKGYKVLTSKIDSARFTNGPTVVMADSDGDMLPDEEEVIYRTNPLLTDTDSDYYSDYEEVMYGWNPIDARLSPGQVGRDKPRDGDVSLPGGIMQTHENPTNTTGNTSVSSTTPNNSVISSISPGISNSSQQGTSGLHIISEDTLYTSKEDSGLLDRVTFGYYRVVLKELESIRKNGMSFEQLLSVGFFLFLLGILHALGPGHSKGFMAAYILGSRASVTQSMGYAVLFTIVHLLDVTVMVLVLKFADGLIDLQGQAGNLLKIGGVGLFFLGLWLLFTSIRTLRENGVKSKNAMIHSVDSKKWKSGIYMAAITGLAPCTFAWSILMILFAIGRLDLILPLILFFGFGVLVSLVCVSLLVYYLREKIVVLSQSRYQYYFPVVSAGIVLILSVIFIISAFAI